MARYTGGNCRLCRREGAKLFLKGERCFSDKCAFEKRGYAPGQHGQRPRRKSSEYGLQLREKQKAKRIYGVLERQFRRHYQQASKERGIMGENFLAILESRLDNVVYRLGLAPSRKAARQLVRHRHLTVNDRVVDIPSCIVMPGDTITVREKSRQMAMIHDALRRMGEGRMIPWLSVDKGNLTGTMLERPKREDIPTLVEEQLIVEHYSK